MKLRDAIVIGATLAGCGMLFYFFCIRPIKELHPTDPGKAERDSLRMEEKFAARLAAAKLQWADSIDAFADHIEAHMLPPETLYIRNHEKALTADVARMRWFMGQRPVDTTGSRYAP